MPGPEAQGRGGAPEDDRRGETAVSRAVRVLMVEDDPDDADLVELALARDDLRCSIRRVTTEADLGAALEGGEWDVVLSDFWLQGFDARAVVRAVQAHDPALPVLVVSGVMGEDTAIELMRLGAFDYLLKDRLARLGPAIRRALTDARGERDRQEAVLGRLESEQRLQEVLRTAADGILIVGDLGLVETANDAARRMLGADEAEVIGAPVGRFLPEVSISLVGNEDGTRFTVIVRDVSERHEFMAQLEHRTLYDALTGLPNRALLADRTERALATRGRNGVAVVFVDLDRLKLVNDSLGHDAGDAVIVQVGQRLREFSSRVDTVARFGGDTFAVLLDRFADPLVAVRLAQEVLRRLDAAYTVSDEDVHVSASVGVAFANGARDVTSATLLRDADAAMHRAKAAGGARVELFDDGAHQQAVARLALERDLRHAVETGELLLHYQPEVRLADGRIVAFEALVRWQHPERGLLPPATFLAVAEATGLLAQAGPRLRREACTAAARMRSAGHPVAVWVNLSAPELLDPSLPDEIGAAIREADLPPGVLCVEITESALLEDRDAAAAAIARLKAQGARVGIDDFGTGYSSLLNLRGLRADVLKVDRSFVAGMIDDPEDATIVDAVVSLADALGLDVVAEGIEDAAQLAVLRELGCTFGQGYLFARPMPLDDALTLLATEPRW